MSVEEEKDSANEVLEAPDKEVLSERDMTAEKLIAFKMTFKDSGCGISSEDQKRLF